MRTNNGVFFERKTVMAKKAAGKKAAGKKAAGKKATPAAKKGKKAAKATTGKGG